MISHAAVASENATHARLSRCLAEIDRASEPFSNGDAIQSEQQLNQLLHSCGNVPQLHHNLGVLDATEQDWSAAIAHFEQSLKLDQRAAMTQQSLASIYQFKAGLAYQKALKLSRRPEEPRFTMQASTLTNVCLPSSSMDTVALVDRSNDSPLEPKPKIEINSPSLRTDELKYDIQSWWTAAREDDLDAYQTYYRDAPNPDLSLTSGSWPDFDDVKMNIEWVDTVALVSLDIPLSLIANDSTDATTDTSQEWLLVMQHSENLWKIVKQQIVRKAPTDTADLMTDSSQ